MEDIQVWITVLLILGNIGVFGLVVGGIVAFCRWTRKGLKGAGRLVSATTRLAEAKADKAEIEVEKERIKLEKLRKEKKKDGKGN